MKYPYQKSEDNILKITLFSSLKYISPAPTKRRRGMVASNAALNLQEDEVKNDQCRTRKDTSSVILTVGSAGRGATPSRKALSPPRRNPPLQELKISMIS
jgi:hypothetical protein